jgi:hypothetical protein
MSDSRTKRIAKAIKPLRVEPGSKVNLSRDFDPHEKLSFVKKKDAKHMLQTGVELLADWPPRTSTACSCACSRWTPAARTGPSGT